MTRRSLLEEFSRGPVQMLLDRGVRRSTTAAELCRQLDGRVLEINSGAPGLTVHFAVNEGEVEMRRGPAEAPDATIEGSPLNLARLAAGDPEAVIREGRVRVTGDDEIATAFRNLLDIVRPDWEEELALVTGDVVAHEVGRAARSLANWARDARHSMGRSMGEYLTEEARAVVGRTEIDEFCAAVDELALATDRLEARLRLLLSRAEVS